MGLFSKLFRNARKPVGFLGKMMVNGMNDGRHAAMANWALASLHRLHLHTDPLPKRRQVRFLLHPPRER